MAALKQSEEAQTLTGVVVGTASDRSLLAATDKEQQRRCGAARLTRRELALLAALLIAGAAAVALAAALGVERSREGKCIPPVCMHALGGGPVRSGGGVDSVTAASCKQELRAYGDTNGAYWKEVQLAIDSANLAFGFANGVAGSSSGRGARQQPAAGVAAGATSRTLLSAALEGGGRTMRHGLQLGGPAAAAAGPPPLQAPPTPSRNQVVVFDIDETVLSNMAQVQDPQAWPWDAWVAAAQAPALQPSLAFYRSLCAAGYSVAFVTGRKEASRNATMRNLEAAGYGRPCSNGGATAASAQQQQQQQHSSDAAAGPFYGLRPSITSSSSGSSEALCCYSALYLRPPGDTRLASVYKPWARRQLLRAGGSSTQLAALVGDQFSDLNGETAAPLAFKLPNPFYFIL